MNWDTFGCLLFSFALGYMLGFRWTRDTGRAGKIAEIRLLLENSFAQYNRGWLAGFRARDEFQTAARLTPPAVRIHSVDRRSES